MPVYTLQIFYRVRASKTRLFLMRRNSLFLRAFGSERVAACALSRCNVLQSKLALRDLHGRRESGV